MHAPRLPTIVCLLMATWLTGCTSAPERTAAGLRDALLLHASFDGNLVFNWDESRSALTLGLGYIGGIDDVAVFNRPLANAEVATLHGLKDGMRGLGADIGR